MTQGVMYEAAQKLLQMSDSMKPGQTFTPPLAKPGNTPPSYTSADLKKIANDDILNYSNNGKVNGGNGSGSDATFVMRHEDLARWLGINTKIY